jgi:ABC-2 type transport system permease protein
VSAAALTLHQLRYDQRAFWRNPAAVFFTVAFPVMLLVIFAAIFGNDEISTLHVNTTTYYVPAILTMAIVSATMQALVMSVTLAREQGRLKRARATPMPAWVFIAGRVGNSIVLSLLMLVLISAIGGIAYSVDIPWDHLPAILIALLVGGASFCCLGLAFTALIPSEDAAAPLINLVLLPLYFISGVFVPEDQIGGVIHIADAFPIRHLFEALFTAFDPNTTGAGFAWGHLAVVAAWGVLGLLLAIRYFRWTPRSG